MVIGSGFGGAVLACRLAEADRSVLVLERGREWAVEDYPSVSGKHWIWDVERFESENGWIELRAFRNMAVVQGAGVGGGSPSYANVAIEADPETFADGWPSGLDPWGESPRHPGRTCGSGVGLPAYSLSNP